MAQERTPMANSSSSDYHHPSSSAFPSGGAAGGSSRMQQQQQIGPSGGLRGPSGGTDLYSIISSAAAAATAGQQGGAPLPGTSATPLPFNLIAASALSSGNGPGGLPFGRGGEGEQPSMDSFTIDDFPALSNQPPPPAAGGGGASLLQPLSGASSLYPLPSMSGVGAATSSATSKPHVPSASPFPPAAGPTGSTGIGLSTPTIASSPKRLPFNQGGGLGSNVFGTTFSLKPSPGAVGSGSVSGSSMSAGATSAAPGAGRQLPSNGKYGLYGLIDIIRMSDVEMNMFSLGLDLTSLGLHLSDPAPLSSTLMSPFSEFPNSGAEPPYLTPPSYHLPAPPPPALSKLPAFSDETLFYIFYGMPRDVLQEAAAQELYNRAWRFHKELKLWLCKDPASETFVKGIGFERGLYIFFDPLAWCRVKKEWLLYYDQLEERGSPGPSEPEGPAAAQEAVQLGESPFHPPPQQQQAQQQPMHMQPGGYMFLGSGGGGGGDPKLNGTSNLLSHGGANVNGAIGGAGGYHHPLSSMGSAASSAAARGGGAGGSFMDSMWSGHGGERDSRRGRTRRAEQFEEDGFLHLPGFLAAGGPLPSVAELRAEAERLLQAFDPSTHPKTCFSTGTHSEHVGDDYFLESGDKVRYFLEEEAVDPATRSLRPSLLPAHAINKIGHYLHELSPPFRALSTSARVRALITALGFHDPRILQSMLILKQPRIGGEVPPHQDSTFLYTEPLSAVGLWFALEYCTPDNGCMYFAPGSHKTVPVRKRFVRRAGGGTEFVSWPPGAMPSPAPAGAQGKAKAADDAVEYMCVPVEAGDLVLIHGSVLHKSSANRSERSRWIYTFHCIEGQARYDDRNWLQSPIPFTSPRPPLVAKRATSGAQERPVDEEQQLDGRSSRATPGTGASRYTLQSAPSPDHPRATTPMDVDSKQPQAAPAGSSSSNNNEQQGTSPTAPKVSASLLAGVTGRQVLPALPGSVGGSLAASGSSEVPSLSALLSHRIYATSGRDGACVEASGHKPGFRLRQQGTRSEPIPSVAGLPRSFVTKRPLILPESSTQAHPPAVPTLSLPAHATQAGSLESLGSGGSLAKKFKVLPRIPTPAEGAEQVGPMEGVDSTRTASTASIHELEREGHQEDGMTAVSATGVGATHVAAGRHGLAAKPARPTDPFAYIAYLQKYGAANEFAYMVPAKRSNRDGTHHNAYDLQIVDYLSVDRKGGEAYFTISLQGVTQFDANGHGVFTPLAQWKREHHLFHALLAIPFFNRYKTWKSFSLWRRAILHSKLMEAKKTLSKKLFIADPAMCTALARIQGLCHDMATQQRLLSVRESHSYGLEEFTNEQQAWVEGPAVQAIEAWRAQIYAAATEASVHCLKRKGFLKDDEGQGATEAPAPVLTVKGAQAPPAKLTFTEQAARRNECRRLQRFVKLVDYMIVHSLHMLTVDSVKGILATVAQGLPDTDVFITPTGTVVLEEGGRIGDVCLDMGDDTMGAEFRNKLSSGLQVGGAMVQEAVATSTLIQCGYEGFSDIISRRAKSKMGKLVHVVDPEEEKLSAAAAAAAGAASMDELAAPAREAKDAANAWKVEKKAKEFVPLFRNELLMHLDREGKAYYFAPSLSSFLACMEGLVKLYLRVAESIPLLGSSIPYLDPSKLSGAVSGAREFEDTEFGDGPRTGAVILEDGYYRELVGRLFGSIIGIFTNITTWVTGLEANRQMWLENNTFHLLTALEAEAGRVPVLLAQIDHVAVSSEHGGNGITSALLSAMQAAGLPTTRPILELANTVRLVAGQEEGEDAISYSPLADFFEGALARFADQSAAMSRIHLSYVINNVLIDTTTLKSILVPSPARCFKEVAAILPLIARDKNEILLNELQMWVRILTTPPATVEGFVEYLEWFEKVKNSMTLVRQCSEEVAKLYQIMELHRIPIQPTDLALFQTLPPTMRSVKETVDMASETKDDSISRFSTELERLTTTLMADVGEIHHQSQDPLILNPNATSDVVLQFLDTVQEKLVKADGLKRRYQEWAALFKAGGLKSEVQKLPKDTDAKDTELEETKAETELKRTLWTSMKGWEGLTTSWRACPFDHLNTEEMNTEINNFLKVVYLLDKGLPPNEVLPRLRKHVEEYRSIYTTIVDLRNPALKQRHWDRIQETVGKVFVRDSNFTLVSLSNYHIFDFKEEIANVSAQASSEAALEEMLTRIIKMWIDSEFMLVSYRDSKDVFIFGSVEDIQTALDDSLVTIATIKGSRFIGPIKNEVEKWDGLINLFASTLDAWLTCQRTWLYLESVFSAPDIQRQLPDEARMFSQVDRSWKETMRKVSRNPNALKSATQPGLLETMKQNNALLEQVQKCLEDYLESKRLLFPRFYFLSNDELLEILSQTKNPQAVQPHLSKCFDAIKCLEFSSSDPKSIDIVAMISPEGERVPFIKTIKARGNVEAWLSNIEEAMVLVLKRLTKSALAEFEDAKRNDWVRDHVGQIVVTGNQVLWTKDVIECFKHNDPAKSLNWLRQKCSSNLTGLAMLVRGELTRLQRATIGALITIDVHNRDIVQSLMAAKVTGQSDFEWTKQMRYYWDVESDGCTVKMASSAFTYGYEYLGCSPRLVITPLTDRCYLTLTGAMQLNLGGSPVGPAGTGKTETVKDLAKALAKQCVVFNCSDGMDYKMMGKMFAGLAQSGAWCCFDEFNRIDIEVLSVIAQQLLTIKQAKDNKVLKFMFEGREIRLIETCCAFITMNPGYAGRTELPDNLKALFRPIAMMIPDYGLISEIILYSEGFENAKLLSGKVVNLFKLCSEQLSQQDFYDFGMRAVKSVLMMAGGLKRGNPELSEDVVLIRALRDSNLPKFISEDVALFKGILQDLFPGVAVPDRDFGTLISVIQELMAEQGLEYVEELCSRICQLQETMKIRHGVMLVGPTGGGKTTCYQLLRDACCRIKERSPSTPDVQHVKTWILNPKCVSMNELYGEFDGATMEWKDGLIGHVFREQVADPSPDEKWTVCDGPVDALWIENMNTVLDDNKLLTLINGERIKMTPAMHMLFEVGDLAVASPATVSRCGMVYMDPMALGWRPYVQRWLRQLPEALGPALRDALWSHCNAYFDRTLRFVRKSCSEHIRSVDLNLVSSWCKLMSSFLQREGLIDFQQGEAGVRVILNHLFAFCLVWSLGGNLMDSSQDAFDTYCRDMFEATPLPDVSFPTSNNIFSYYFDFKLRTFTPWEEIVPEFKYNPATPYFQMIVPTADTVKYVFLLETLLRQGCPVLLSGSTGVGKSIIVQMGMQSLSREGGFLPLTLNFSAQTSSHQIQNLLQAKLEKKRKNTIGAPHSYKRVALFVDDVNIAKLDRYGAQPPVELLRQQLNFGGFYDREQLQWKVVEDVVLVAAAAPPGGGRNHVTPRLLRHFNLLNVPSPTEQSLGVIFRSIVEGFLKPFSADVKAVSEAIISSSIEIYHRMCTELLPTPAKSHYTFNLRDLSKVVQGILQCKPQVIANRQDMAKLFAHEASRIFHDRLIDAADRTYFHGLLATLVESNFGVALPKEALRTIMYGDFAKRGIPQEDKVYAEIADFKAIGNTLEEFLEEYNINMNKEVRLIFFMDAKLHIARIARILRQPRGNALLVGVGGTGKQSLTRLAAYMADYKCHQVELTRTYGIPEWREDLKRLYVSAGAEGRHTVFLLSDTQIKSEAFLEDINSILNSGEVENLLEFDEREKILGELRPLCRERGLPEDRDSVYQFFISRVRDHLHIVFATSPIGDAFRNRCRMFPSLVNCCTIDWFDEWPQDALLSVSQRFLEFVDLGGEEMRDKFAGLCVDIHLSVGQVAKKFYQELKRRYYTTPTSYLEFINLYVAMLHEKRKELGSSRDRLMNGLNKLAETNEMVAKMQVELELLGPELKQRAADTEELMVVISHDQEKADEVRKVVAEEELIVREKAIATEAIATEAQRDLDEALPALEAAYNALDALEKKDIAELKVFSKPPELVLLVMEAICILFKVKPDWDSSKKLLSDPQLMKKMAEYDKDNIPDSISKKLRKYIDNPLFTPDQVEKVSKACKSMCMWVIAMDIYSRVFAEVAPKRKKLEDAQATLEATRAKLAEKAAALAEVEAQLQKLKTQYEESVASKKALIEKMAETKNRMARAGKLTLALADEEVRWRESVGRLNTAIDDLAGNIFLSAAGVAYFGAFTSGYRDTLAKSWIARCMEMGIPVSAAFNLPGNLSDPATIRDWNIQGLPSDKLSIENGVLVTRGRRWPLMIDPQGQANRWIRTMEGANLKVLKLSDPKFLRALENAVRTGQAVLLEDVGETLDPAIEPLLLKQTIRQGGRLLMKLGDSLIEYDRNFKLYITTKLPNPHYLPEVCIKVTVINFTVTKEGLEGQLLGEVVKLERPELEEQRNSLIVNISNDKRQLREVEEKILRMLFAASGNILDDEELIDTLNQSKVTSAAIKERVAQAEVTEESINTAREKYRPVALRGSVLYFTVADLAEIDPMYQFSLKYFKILFTACILKSERPPSLEARIDILCTNSTQDTFQNVSRGLFEAHKLIFAFLLCVETMKERGRINMLEWNFFLRGGLGAGASAAGGEGRERPSVSWLSEGAWRNLLDLSATIPQFAYVVDHLVSSPAAWSVLVESEDPYHAPIPGDHWGVVTPFQRILLIKVLREERLVDAVVDFVKENLGADFVDSPPLDLYKIGQDMSATVPLVFVLSSGSDPVSSLVKYAAMPEVGMQERLHMISLGQGQGPIAEELLKRTMASGDWVFLQNCHLAASWMPRLEGILKELGTDPAAPLHPNFRLFLSSMPSKVFPISVLQESLKITNEPPKGLKANLARSFADVPKDLYEDHPPQGAKFKKLLFGLCFFNAIIHERKKFGPLGWNIRYDWSNSDLEVSMSILKGILLEQPKIVAWEALLYLTGEITFGGRVTDEWDRRALKSILRKYYCPSILDDSYAFTASGTYYAPADSELATVRKYIDGLPYSEGPAVFGLHENANISYQVQEVKRLVKTVLEVQPRISPLGASGKSSEDVVMEMAVAVLRDWPAPLDVDLYQDRPKSGSSYARKSASSSGAGAEEGDEGESSTVHIALFERDSAGRMVNSLSTVLLQEVERFKKLNNIVRSSLEGLIKAIKGEVVMSVDLELVFKSILNGEVPQLWASNAYPSLKPLQSWVKDFHARVGALAKWAYKGQPDAFWLPGFFFPQGFLTGVLQNHARKHGLPIDTLFFSYEVTDYASLDELTLSKAEDDEPEAEADGVLVYGLYLEGARWDRIKRTLQESYAMEMYSSVPVMRFLPTHSRLEVAEEGKYTCPLYKTSARAGTLSTTGQSTNFVVPIQLPSDRPADYWVSQGVALLCQLNE